MSRYRSVSTMKAEGSPSRRLRSPPPPPTTGWPGWRRGFCLNQKRVERLTHEGPHHHPRRRRRELLGDAQAGAHLLVPLCHPGRGPTGDHRLDQPPQRGATALLAQQRPADRVGPTLRPLSASRRITMCPVGGRAGTAGRAPFWWPWPEEENQFGSSGVLAGDHQPVGTASYVDRITVDPGKTGEQPCACDSSSTRTAQHNSPCFSVWRVTMLSMSATSGAHRPTIPPS